MAACPSMPHGLHLKRAGKQEIEWLGSVFSDLPLASGHVFSRPTAGGGGYGDPLERDPAMVREDVADGYVSIERAARDYGVVLEVIDLDLCASRSTLLPRSANAQISARRGLDGSRRIRRRSPLAFERESSTRSTWYAATRLSLIGVRASFCQGRPRSSATCSAAAPRRTGPRPVRRSRPSSGGPAAGEERAAL